MSAETKAPATVGEQAAIDALGEPWSLGGAAVEIGLGIERTVYLVRDSAAGRALVKAGISRGRIWLAADVAQCRARGVTVEDARMIAQAMITLDAGFDQVKAG